MTDSQLLPLQRETSLEIVLMRLMTTMIACEAVAIRFRRFCLAKRIKSLMDDLKIPAARALA